MSGLLEPQGLLFFLLLVAAFGALLWWLAVAKRLVSRILAACLAFVPAMIFGVAAVNKYYDYYQTWSSAYADLTNQNLSAPVLPYLARHPRTRFNAFLGTTSHGAAAAQQGFMLRLIVRGPISHITRSVYVYLPPQYFQAAYRGYRFPVIELIHGFPGVPQAWITVLGVNGTLRNLIGAGLAKPAVLVMPDASGGRGISLQCLNQVRGPQDATYLARDLPGYISRTLRVAPPGGGWGIAGYSEGGFCAANLGLQYRHSFGFSGVLSGYFKPSPNQLGHGKVSPFGANLRLQLANTPDYEVTSLAAGTVLPRFWLGVGTADRSGLQDTQIFYQLLRHLQPGAPLNLVSGAHTASTWRELLPPMLEWMTRGLASQSARISNPAVPVVQHATIASKTRRNPATTVQPPGLTTPSSPGGK
jgi:enterochelin esterase-like enzyme